MELLLLILLVLMIIGAVIAIETRDLLSSVICVSAVGYCTSVAYLLLGAPEIAITQVVVEVLVLVMFIRATVSRDQTEPAGEREFFGLTVTVALLLVAAVGLLRVAGVALPEFGEPIFLQMDGGPALPAAPGQHYLAQGFAETGAANRVAGILLGYRGLDALLATGILFASVVGMFTVLRARARKGITEPPPTAETVAGEVESVAGTRPGMTVVVQTVTRWVVGFIFLFGIYLIAGGHLAHGGGFAGGIIIACGFIVVTLAFGKEETYRFLSRRSATRFFCLGGLALVALGAAGWGAGAGWFGNPLRGLVAGSAFSILSAGTLPLQNLAIGITVFASVVILFISLSALRVVGGDADRRLVKRG